jgi:hypothetical protein
MYSIDEVVPEFNLILLPEYQLEVILSVIVRTYIGGTVC